MSAFLTGILIIAGPRERVVNSLFICPRVHISSSTSTPCCCHTSCGPSKYLLSTLKISSKSTPCATVRLVEYLISMEEQWADDNALSTPAGEGTEAPEIQRLNMAASRNVRTRIRLESEENVIVRWPNMILQLYQLVIVLWTLTQIVIYYWSRYSSHYVNDIDNLIASSTVCIEKPDYADNVTVLSIVK